MAIVVNSHNNAIAIFVFDVLCSLVSPNLKNISPKLPAVKNETKQKTSAMEENEEKDKREGFYNSWMQFSLKSASPLHHVCNFSQRDSMKI